MGIPLDSQKVENALARRRYGECCVAERVGVGNILAKSALAKWSMLLTGNYPRDSVLLA
jgi:hypothetical protein